MARWTSAQELTDPEGDDLLLVADVSEPIGTRDRTLKVGALQAMITALSDLPAQQGTHGFYVGDPVRFDGNEFAIATADTAGNAAMVGLVSAVADEDNFVVRAFGFVDLLSATLAPGTYYYLQDDGSFGTAPGTVAVRGFLAITETLVLLRIGG